MAIKTVFYNTSLTFALNHKVVQFFITFGAYFTHTINATLICAVKTFSIDEIIVFTFITEEAFSIIQEIIVYWATK